MRKHVESLDTARITNPCQRVILSITMGLLFCMAKAQNEAPIFLQFKSNDSAVWMLIMGQPGTVYSIVFGKSGKIRWTENDELYDKLWKYHVEIRDQEDNGLYDKNGNLWRTGWASGKGQSALFCNDKVIHMLPYNVYDKVHIRDNGEVWTGGFDYVGYYHNGVFTRIFLIDKYKAQGTDIYTCTEGVDCPEEKKVYDSGDGYPTAIYFSDGRKIGYIKDPDGYVNFRTAPNISAPIIGIILDRVRVFYWDDNPNNNWYRVEVSEVSGYVHKSRIVPR